MNGSPVTSWDDVSAYFTFADSPAAIAVFLLLTCAVLVGVIAQSARHEREAFRRVQEERGGR